MHSSDGLERRQASCERPRPIEHAIATEDDQGLVAEVPVPDFANWCYVSGHDSSAPDAVMSNSKNTSPCARDLLLRQIFVRRCHQHTVGQIALSRQWTACSWGLGTLRQRFVHRCQCGLVET